MAVDKIKILVLKTTESFGGSKGWALLVCYNLPKNGLEFPDAKDVVRRYSSIGKPRALQDLAFLEDTFRVLGVPAHTIKPRDFC